MRKYKIKIPEECTLLGIYEAIAVAAGETQKHASTAASEYGLPRTSLKYFLPI